MGIGWARSSFAGEQESNSLLFQAMAIVSAYIPRVDWPECLSKPCSMAILANLGIQNYFLLASEEASGSMSETLARVNCRPEERCTKTRIALLTAFQSAKKFWKPR